MECQSKDEYGPWDSPHTFCQYQVEFKPNKFTCSANICSMLLDILDVYDALNEDEENKKVEKGFKTKMDKKYTCPFTEKTASKCASFVYHKHDKNPTAKRYKEKR